MSDPIDDPATPEPVRSDANTSSPMAREGALVASAAGSLPSGATCSLSGPDGHLWRELKAAELPTASAVRRHPPGRRRGRHGPAVGRHRQRRRRAARAAPDVFHFHPLAIEDTLSTESRVRVEQYEDAYLFAIVRGVAFQEATPDPYDLRTQNLYFFIGRHYLVTVLPDPRLRSAPCAARSSGTRALWPGAPRGSRTS
jgi:hypothetical protein